MDLSNQLLILPIEDSIDISITDSTPLYLYFMFRLLGLYLRYHFLNLLNKIPKKHESLFVCTDCISWTRDIF